MLRNLKKVERPVSFTLMLCLIFELTFPLTSNASPQSGGGGTVASSLSSMVDGYTGDFHYSVPLVTVPGPNGESVSVNANYRAGIAVNQKASWIGLGWDYNPGEISRQVVNMPDDYNGVSVTQYYSNTSSSLTYTQVVAMFGSLYNNNINNQPYGSSTSYNKCGDNKNMLYSLTQDERCNMIAGSGNIGSSANCYTDNFAPTSNSNYRFNRHTVPYTGLAYDQYNISGEGIGGALHPYYLGEVQIHPEVNAAQTGFPVSNKKCQFYFENSSFKSIYHGNEIAPDVVNQSTNRIHSGTFVKYFTNDEINNNANLYSSTNTSGYLHYQPVTNTSVVRRPNATDKPDLIGAFQVTNASGMTYHYSLPVYTLKDLSASFDGQGNGQAQSLFSCMYASSWKLTAITGADYEDTNGNYTADEGDTGYWISYNYSLWSSNYGTAAQRYNAKSDALISPKMTNLVTSVAVGNRYKKNYSLSFGESQVYVLNYIKTATHTAYFVKSIRQDEQSYDNILNISVKPVALLKLDRVVLLRNENKNLLINTTALSGTDLDARFEYATCGSALNDPNFINVTRYNSYKQAIDQVALSTAELSYDYSLAKKYIGNINNSFSKSNAVFSSFNIPGYGISTPGGQSFYAKLTGFVSSSASTNNGKLTLKKITTYNLNGEKITPSVDFSYNESSSTKNPDFNVDATDLWGYYKKDYVNSHYVTAVSKDDVDAWSLKEINTSLGGKINITYESDRYHKEGFNGDAPFYHIFTGNPLAGTTPTSSNIPHLIFPFKQTGNLSEVSFADNDFSVYDHEPSPPAVASYAIYSTLDQCSHPIVYNNGGNQYYYPPTYYHLIRHQCSVAYQNGSSPGLVANAYNLAGTSIPEYDLNCTQPGYSFGSTPNTSGDLGVDHEVVFRSYLYGGGVRVKQISVTDPFSTNVYTQNFDYGDGYCPIVPKPTAFSTYSGPSNHDVVMNTKPLMDSKLTGQVGYDFCKQYSINSKSETTGTITQSFSNDLIVSPLSLNYPQMTSTWYYRNNFASPYGGGCSGTLTHNTGDKFFDYTMKLDLSLSSNSSSLGRLDKVTDGSNSTVYNYNKRYINEQYLHPTGEDVRYPFSFVYPTTGTSQCIYTYDQTDHYHYDRSFVTNWYSFLGSTTTTKDGISITEEIGRDDYTAATSYVKTTDPTRGVYESTTSFAYKAIASGNTLLYPTMDLKSKNEANRNILTPVVATKTIKDGKYVISESKATYSNVYPLRVRLGNTPNYGITSVTKPWYHLNETYERLLDDDVLTTVIPTGTDWRKVSTNTLYDASYNCIEQEGLNSRKTASRWGYKNLYKLASITNANYNSFTFSGFEDAVVGPGNNNVVFGGEISHGETMQGPSVSTGNTAVLIKPHTGFSLAGINPNQAGPSFNTTNFEVGRTYIAKVWVHKLSPPAAALTIQLNGTAGSALSVTKTVTRNNSANVTVGDWVLMSTEIEVPDNFNTSLTHNMTVSLSNTGNSKAYFDDFSFHPKDAVVTGNVYNEKTGALMAQLDNDNFATFYNYDNALRLTTTYKEYSGGTKKISESIYHYAKP